MVNYRRRPHEEDLSETDRVLLGLYDRSQVPIPWDKFDDAILAAAGAAQPDATAEDALDEADGVVLELYRRGKVSIPWDESDDAILTFARQASTANDDRPASGADLKEPEAPLGDNVTRFPAHRIVRRVFATPAAGWAIAASLIGGIFVGQGITPYVNLGVAPDLPDLLAENTRLSGEMSDAQSEIVRLSQEFKTRGIRVTDESEETVPTPGTETAAIPAPGIAELGHVLDQFECASLSATVRQGSGLVIRGHVASADDMNRLQGALAPYTEVARVSNQAHVYAWPRCEAVELLEALTTANAPASPSVQPFEHGSIFREGERLVLEASAASAPGYLYVDFVQNDGNVIHLVSGRFVAAGERIRVGDDTDLRIAPPFGAEMLMVVQSDEPLFAADRPQVERADIYLPALAAVSDPGTLSSGFTFLTTQPAP